MSAVAVLGAGQVGQAIARRALEVGYAVTVGARSNTSASLSAFAEEPDISTGSYREAVASADLVVNATPGDATLAVFASVGRETLAGKVILDLSNDLAPAPGGGFPLPTATAENSLGLRLQQSHPEARVVKALNTMNHQVMVRPDLIPGDHLAFVCGDDDDAKETVRTLLRDFGWRGPQLMDLGGIDAAGATEMMMAVWMRVTMARGFDSPRFNWAVLSAREV